MGVKCLPSLCNVIRRTGSSFKEVKEICSILNFISSVLFFVFENNVLEFSWTRRK